MKDVLVIEVRIWGRSVGAVTLDPSLAYYAFEYDSAWKRTGTELAPLHMPLKGTRSVYVFPTLPEATYFRLPAQIPMVAAMRRELISESYTQADETPVDVQTREGRGKNHQAYLGQYSRPGGGVVFGFRLGRGRDGPKRFLGQVEGVLETDGYAAYDQIGGPRMVYAACWSHARRAKFFEALVQLNPRDPVATPIVAQMDELFAVDAEARRKTLTSAARHIRRQETARPLLDDIRSKIESSAVRWLCASSAHLARPVSTRLALWKKLTPLLGVSRD